MKGQLRMAITHMTELFNENCRFKLSKIENKKPNGDFPSDFSLHARSKQDDLQ
jgi:hypothetical protein